MMKRRTLAAALLGTTFLFHPSEARAELISGAIGLTALIAEAGVGTGIVIGGATITAGAIGGAIITGAVAVGMSVLSAQLAKPNDAGQSPTASGSVLSVQYGANIARSAQLGPGATGGHHVYTNVAGPENKLLQCVFVIGDGQHGKLTKLTYNGKVCSIPVDIPAGGWAPIEFKWIINGALVDCVTFRYYKGRYDQAADGSLITWANPAGRWTANHRGAGICYLAIDQIYCEELGLTGVPTILAETEGLVLYDYRKDDTNGGSGPHRWGQIDTYEPSSNPAVQEYNFRRGITINGQRVLGMNVSPVNLLLQMYIAAANDNDIATPLAEGGTEPRYRCSVRASDDRANSDVLAAIRSSCAGFLLERGGQFGPISGWPQIPDSTLTFTDDDLIVGERATFSKYRTRSDIVTAVYGSFSDPAQDWQSVSFPARENATDDATMGEKIAQQIDLTQVYSSSQAQRIAESERRRKLQQGQGVATLGAKWIGVQPGDWLTYNSARHGNMTVLITGTHLDTASQLVTLTYERISSSVYSWTTAGELFPPDVGAGGQPGTIIMSAAGMTASGVNVPGDGGLVIPGIQFAWTPILDPSVDQIDFNIRKVGDTAILPFTADFPDAGTAVCTHGIQAATNYEFQHKLYTTPVRETPWSAWLTVTSGSTQVVQGALTSVPLDEVTLAMFEASLKDYVAKQLSTSMEQVDMIEQLIASNAADQDAANEIQKRLEKGSRTNADTKIVEQVSAQFGTTWRGDWNAATQYVAGDQVRYSGLMYWAVTDVPIGLAPPATPWAQLLTSSVISQEWLTFTDGDGAAAQTSNMIEARFTGGPVGGVANDLPTSVANIISKWSAFAGGDFAAAQTSDSIESRFGTMTAGRSVASIDQEWKTFAAPDSASGSTRTDITAAIGTNSVNISTNATAIATIDGKVAGTWQVTINANGYVSGIKAYNDGATSVFVVLADNFLVAKPVAGGSPVPVFDIGTYSGPGGPVTKMVLRGDMIVDGSIYSSHIVAGQITGIKIAANTITADKLVAETVDTAHITGGAITIAQSATLGGAVPGNGTGAEKNILSITLNVPNTINGSAIPILATAGCVFQIGNAGAAGITGFLKINGAIVDQSMLLFSTTAGSAAKFNFSGTANVTGNGGTVAVSVTLSMTTGGNSDFATTPGNLAAFAFKR